jgi:ATP-binding cassette, subfamily B, bacterial PglK
MIILKKLWRLLIVKQRQKAVILLGLMLVGMVLETLGIGMVAPALILMTQSDLLTKYPEVGVLFELLGNPSREYLITLGMLFLVSIYAIKAFFLAFLAWVQSKFIFGLQANLSQRLFTGYIFLPYTFHLQRNSAQLIRNVTSEVSLFSSVSQSLLVLISEIVVLIGISILLLVVEPFGTSLVMVILGLSGWIFYQITRSYISKWGKIRQHHEGQRIQHLQQGLGGAKDVKLLGREEEFLTQYNYHTNISSHVGQRQYVIQQFPRLWLELLAIIGLSVLVLVIISQGDSLDNLIPTLGLFAAAAFRLMPSVNRILIALQSLRFAVPVINTLYQELQLFKEVLPIRTSKISPLKNSLALNEISFKYPEAEKYSLRGITINISKGTSVGFIGGSGAGKSTLIDIILGLLKPESGTVKVDGVNIQTNLRSWQDFIGYVPQSIFLTDDTLRRNIAFGLSSEQIDESAIWSSIRAAQLESYINGLPEGLDTIVGERGVRLSGGERQRIGIARALYHDPAVLVLDEATSSLDTETERGVMKTVSALQGKKTILIVAHRLSTIEHCDYLFQLDNGKVVKGGEASDVLDCMTPNIDNIN